MYARVVMFKGVKDIDAGVAYLKETALPVLQSQRGYRGVSAGADRSSGILGVMSLWETASDRDASESALAKNREEARSQLASDMTVDSVEQVAVQVSKPPAVGSPLVLTRISMDPGRVADNVEFFKREIIPQISSAPGFRSVRNLINPETGEGMVSTIWDDEQSRQNALEAAQSRRADAATRGVTFGETILGEIVFTDVK
jgi:heme-degrading monooxygenase HmoA